uniref:Helicase ATP-binding domain-containing protein n=1 Tax=viral metagenome TaxID=1070528 RepID=A0A6C0M1P7_9ZZZZ
MDIIKDVSYPSIQDDEFQRKLYEKREFHINRIPESKNIESYDQLKQYRDDACAGNFQLLSQQNLLANFINPDTPFRGLLIFHGLGSGKTCTALAICEKFKEQVKKYNTKIYILVPGPLNKEGWKDELVKCTRDTYRKEGDSNIIDKNEKEKALCRAKASALQYYRIMSYRGFYKKVLGQKIIEKKTDTEGKKKSYKKTEEGEYERELSIDRIDNLNNSIIVVDEAHNITGNEYGLALQKVIENSQNLRVLLMSATPMKNLGDDIVEMINYLRPKNDPMMRDKIFSSDKNYNMALKPSGIDYFKKMAQGYVSFYRGSNLLTFAKQVDMGEIPKELLFTSIVRCPMDKFQLTTYNSVKEDKVAALEDALERRSAAVANFAIPGLDTSKNVIGYFGREGLSTLRNQLNSNKLQVQTKIRDMFFSKDINPSDVIYETKNKSLSGLIFKQPYINNFSIKFANCLDNILQLVKGKKGSHTAFIYSNLVKSGIELFEQTLLQNGCLEWNDTASYQINDDTRDAITGIPYAEYLKSNIQRQFYPMTFLTITGQSEESKDAIPEEKKRILDNVFSQIDNYDGRNIKFILGSKVMNEGISLRNVKEVHILDVYFNLGKVHQVIGRAIRHCVHYDIMTEDNPYPQVNVFRYTVSLPNFQKLSTEEELYQKAELKYLLIKKIERAMKEIAIDCPLNYNGNITREELEEFNECIPPENNKEKNKLICPATCDYTKCDYRCGDKSLELKYYDRTTNFYKKIPKDNLDYSTFTTKLARAEIDTAKDIIKELYRFQYVYTLDEITKNILKSYPEDKKDMLDLFFVYQALDELIPITENDFNNFKDTIYDKYSIAGYIIYRNKYYIFQPFNENEDTLMYYRSNYISELNHELSVYEYMTTNTKIKEILEATELKKPTKEPYKYTMEYYDERTDNFVVGVLDSHHGEDVFKLREQRQIHMEERKKHRIGTASVKGAICQTAKEKDELIDLAKKIGVKQITSKTASRMGLCDIIKNRLMYLEKYGDDNKVYMIIPNNHPTYQFPLRLSDRVEYINKLVSRILFTNVIFEKKKQDNGIFEGLRDISLPRYSIKFKHVPDYLKYQDELQKLDFELKGDYWHSIIE